MKVWTLTATSRHGVSMWVYATEELANRYFIEEIRRDWPEWSDEPAPEDNDELLDAWVNSEARWESEQDYIVECLEVIES